MMMKIIRRLYFFDLDKTLGMAYGTPLTGESYVEIGRQDEIPIDWYHYTTRNIIDLLKLLFNNNIKIHIISAGNNQYRKDKLIEKLQTELPEFKFNSIIMNINEIYKEIPGRHMRKKKEIEKIINNRSNKNMLFVDDDPDHNMDGVILSENYISFEENVESEKTLLTDGAIGVIKQKLGI
jgi:hypothetical protein